MNQTKLFDIAKNIAKIIARFQNLEKKFLFFCESKTLFLIKKNFFAKVVYWIENLASTVKHFRFMQTNYFLMAQSLLKSLFSFFCACKFAGNATLLETISFVSSPLRPSSIGISLHRFDNQQKLSADSDGFNLIMIGGNVIY